MPRLRRLPIVRPIETDDREAMALACAHRLSPYDARYLTLALREDRALSNLDRRLNEASAAESVVAFA